MTEAMQRCRRCKLMKPLSAFEVWNVPRCKACIALQLENWKAAVLKPGKKKPRKRTKKST